MLIEVNFSLVPVDDEMPRTRLEIGLIRNFYIGEKNEGKNAIFYYFFHTLSYHFAPFSLLNLPFLQGGFCSK
jgi:hypothetical protein